jgi:hypothetical protein
MYRWVTVIEECPAIRANVNTSPWAAVPSIVRAVCLRVYGTKADVTGEICTR